MVTSNPDASGWKLCFLSGPMSGRTLWLALGENWIGTGADCEVILPDREIAARQLCLNVGSIAVSIQNFGGAPVTLNGASLGEMRRTLVAGDTVTVASIKFGVEHTAGAMPLPSGTASSAGPKRGRRDGHSSWLASMLPGWLGALGSRRLIFALLALWSAVALAAGGYVAVATRGAFWWSHQSKFERIREVEAALRQYPELTIEPGTGDEIAVSGYVRDANEHARVAAIANGFTSVTLGEVYVVNELLAAAQQTLSDTPLKATYAGRGHIVIAGVANRAVWQRVQNFKRDAKPAIDVIDRVDYDDNAAGAFIVTTGGAVPADITGIYGDDSGTRYLVTRDGRHFFEGATLPNGLTVTSIESGRVVFERNGERYVVTLGAGAASSTGAAQTSAGGVATSASGPSGTGGPGAVAGSPPTQQTQGAPADAPAAKGIAMPRS